MNLCCGIWFTIKRLSILICHLFSNACFPARSTTNIPGAPEPNYSPFCITAQSSANVPKRLCSLVIKAKNTTPALPTATLLSFAQKKHPQTTGSYPAIKPNLAWLCHGHKQQTCAYAGFFFFLMGEIERYSICRQTCNPEGVELYNAYIHQLFRLLLGGNCASKLARTAGEFTFLLLKKVNNRLFHQL